MGQILKYLLVALILYYLWNNHLKKMINVFFKGSSSSSAGNNQSNNGANGERSYRKEEPKVTSRSQNTSAASGKDFKGGEYVDFEEVE